MRRGDGPPPASLPLDEVICVSYGHGKSQQTKVVVQISLISCKKPEEHERDPKYRLNTKLLRSCPGTAYHANSQPSLKGGDFNARSRQFLGACKNPLSLCTKSQFPYPENDFSPDLYLENEALQIKRIYMEKIS